MTKETVSVTFTGETRKAVIAQVVAFAKAEGTVTASASGSGKAAAASGKKGAKAAADEDDEELNDDEESEELEESEDDEAEELNDDEESEELEESEDDEELADEPANKKKAASGKKGATETKPAAGKTKIKLAQVNAAVIKYTKEVTEDRAKTKKIMKKHFGCETVSEIKESDYAKALKVFAVEE